MARPKHPEELAPLGFRLPVTLIARIDAYCDKVEGMLAGHKVSRSDAIRVLLEKALTAEGFPPASATKPTKRK